MSKGPLAGIRILELAGIGPGPMAATMLADMGADVIRIDRTTPMLMDQFDRKYDITGRSRRSIAIDLSQPDGVALALRLADSVDGLIEGFRPGVAERMGIGPEALLARNPRLVYGRITGWGQQGPLAKRAGHDLNYLAVTGALNAMGRTNEVPVPPLNLAADGTGAMLMAFGMVCGLFEAKTSGRGQVVDAAMVDSVGTVFANVLTIAAAGGWSSKRGTNLIDSGAPFYEVYETADGQYVSVAAIEPQFYAELVRRIGWDMAELPAQNDTRHWPAMKERFATLFAEKTRDEWCALLDDGDTCFAPVLTVEEAVAADHAKARDTHRWLDGVVHPAPAPRFSRSGEVAPSLPPHRGRDSDAVLAELGLAGGEIAGLRERGVVA
jgi:alpha-methylacyl-CoA racemase